MTLVAKLDGLLARDLRLRHPRRSVDGGGQPEEAADEEKRAEDADPSNRVRTTMKDLRHRFDEGAKSELTASCRERSKSSATRQSRITREDEHTKANLRRLPDYVSSWRL